MEDCHWLSSLRGRLRQTHGPSSESHQSHRDDQFGHYWQTDVFSGHLTHLALNIVWYRCQTKCLLLFSLLLLRITWEGNIALWANHRQLCKVTIAYLLGLCFKRLCLRTKKVKKWMILTIFAFSFTFNRHTKMSGWLFNVHGHRMTRYSYEYFAIFGNKRVCFLAESFVGKLIPLCTANVMILRAVHLA